jgi:hypothetical protein
MAAAGSQCVRVNFLLQETRLGLLLAEAAIAAGTVRVGGRSRTAVAGSIPCSLESVGADLQ